jgi:hypothetical protein
VNVRKEEFAPANFARPLRHVPHDDHGARCRPRRLVGRIRDVVLDGGPQAVRGVARTRVPPLDQQDARFALIQNGAPGRPGREYQSAQRIGLQK